MDALRAKLSSRQRWFKRSVGGCVNIWIDPKSQVNYRLMDCLSLGSAPLSVYPFVFCAVNPISVHLQHERNRTEPSNNQWSGSLLSKIRIHHPQRDNPDKVSGTSHLLSVQANSFVEGSLVEHTMAMNIYWILCWYLSPPHCRLSSKILERRWWSADTGFIIIYQKMLKWRHRIKMSFANQLCE